MADVLTTPDFVNIDLVLASSTLTDNAIEDLRAAWVDWEPNDGDLEVVALEEISPMAAALAWMAMNMPKEALRGLGTKILGIPYDAGTPADTEVTLTMVDLAGYTVDSGSQINIDGYAFETAAPVVVPAGSDVVEHVPVYCAVATAAANGLTGDVVNSLTMPVFVIDIVVERATADGLDAMDDDAYLKLIVEEMTFRARTLITATNFAMDALRVAGIGRSSASENTAREITVWVTGTNGLAATPEAKAAVLARYADARSINITYAVNNYDYCVVNVNWSVLGDSAVDAATITSTVNTVLDGLLNPLTWPGAATIPKNLLLARIGDAVGVKYPLDLVLSSPTLGAVVEANGDLVMPGTKPLPQVGVLTPAVSYA